MLIGTSIIEWCLNSTNLIDRGLLLNSPKGEPVITSYRHTKTAALPSCLTAFHRSQLGSVLSLQEGICMQAALLCS